MRRNDAEVTGEDGQVIEPAPLVSGPDGGGGSHAAMQQQERLARARLYVVDAQPIRLDVMLGKSNFRFG
jgi:hypothetical protein